MLADENPLAITPNLPALIASLEQWLSDTKPRPFVRRSAKLPELTEKLRAYKDSRDRYDKLRSSAPASGTNSLPHRRELQAEYHAGAKALEEVVIAFGQLGLVTGNVKKASDSLLAEFTKARALVAAGQLQHQDAVRILENGHDAREQLEDRRLGDNIYKTGPAVREPLEGKPLPPLPVGPEERRSDSRGYPSLPQSGSESRWSRDSSEIGDNLPEQKQPRQRLQRQVSHVCHEIVRHVQKR